MVYHIGRFFLGLYFYFFYRVKVTGKENIPKKGGFVLCCNHSNYRDPMIIGPSVPRPICFIGKKELYKNKFFTLVLKGVKAIPVDRSISDVKSYKAILAKLEQGECVGIFAQGTRVKDIEAKDAKSGAAFFALKAGVPIVPLSISSEFKHFSNVYVNIGKPITLDEYKDVKIKSYILTEIAEGVMKKISELQQIK